MKRKKQKNGISLIVLVITILVMIILAATIIITLNNNGIIDKANEAVDKTNEKQVEELANLAWADAYAENVGKSDEELLPLLKASVEKALSDNNLNKEDYGIYVTTTGVTVAKGWLQTVDRTVVKGDTVLNIGDDISYDETNGGTVTVEKDVDWKVLGAENGELLIVSCGRTGSAYEMQDLEKYKNFYKNLETILNEKCAQYGKGAYAKKARSLTIEDMLKVAGYDGKKTDIVTFTYNGTNKPSYSYSNGTSGTLPAHSNGFYWYDENGEWQYVTADELVNEDNIGKTIGKTIAISYDYSKLNDLLIEDEKIRRLLDFYVLLDNKTANLNYHEYGYSMLGTNYTNSIEYGGEIGLIIEQWYILSDGSTRSDVDFLWTSIQTVVHLSPEYNP